MKIDAIKTRSLVLVGFRSDTKIIMSGYLLEHIEFMTNRKVELVNVGGVTLAQLPSQGEGSGMRISQSSWGSGSNQSVIIGNGNTSTQISQTNFGGKGSNQIIIGDNNNVHQGSGEKEGEKNEKIIIDVPLGVDVFSVNTNNKWWGYILHCLGFSVKLIVEPIEKK